MDYGMSAILDKFAFCDKFSLTWASVVEQVPQEEKDRLSNIHLQQQKVLLRQYYDRTVQDKNVLPEFDVLIEEIFDECKQFHKKIEGRDISEFFGTDFSPFICDHVGKDTKYSEPLNFCWHAYHNLHMVLMSDERLGKMTVGSDYILQVLDDPKYAALKDNLINYEFTYQTHCTGGNLQLVYYFKLNDQTKEWLNQFENDYAIEGSGFEDLAIYNGDKVEFSSCTHEGFNSLD